MRQSAFTDDDDMTHPNSGPDHDRSQAYLPPTQLPPWSVEDLPKPDEKSEEGAPRSGWQRWAGLIGPGVVMCGMQIGGGEWLFGPEITARYGGGLMWIATIAIIVQMFFNLEAGRYALYCGEPVMTGFMRMRPGPTFWIGVIMLVNIGALIPGLSTHGAAVIASMYLGRPPGVEDQTLVQMLAYITLGAVVLPVLVGGKVYNTLQTVMTIKVLLVLGFCLVIGVFFVTPANWWNVLSGFVAFGNVPVSDGADGEIVVNAFAHWFENGEWPVVALTNIAVLGAFAGYAGGGGLSNAAYANYVRDKGWGMGQRVGAIPSAIGGKKITLSHLGKVFPLTEENLQRWKGWWRYILRDQLVIWVPGCFAGMALPALLSLEFARFSPLYEDTSTLDWAQAVITADGIRNAPQFSQAVAGTLWILTLFVGMAVLLPSQMSIVDGFSRRWTDIAWSGSRYVREKMNPKHVNRLYYGIVFSYVAWSYLCAWYFTTHGSPKLMVILIANLNNVALAVTAFALLRVNTRFLPPGLRPRLHHRLGLFACGVFYMGMSILVFMQKQWPAIVEYFSSPPA